jgi:hypothetical protein
MEKDMIGQDQQDGDEDTPVETSTRKTVGVRLAEDDLNVGDYVCVYNLKRQPDEGAPIMGQSLQIKAVCLPYFVGQLLSDPGEPILTLDCRYLNLMRVTEEFVKAQREGAKQQPDGSAMMTPPPKRRKKAEDGQ